MNQDNIAVVVGQGGYNDMGLIRSCGEAGMGVVVVSPSDSVMPIHKSRYVKKWIPCRIVDSSSLVRVIKSVKDEFPVSRIIVFPASDLCACIIDEVYEDLAGIAVVPHAGGFLRKLMDKAEMVRIADESGLDVPYSLRVDLRTDPSPVFGLPCIIKPLRSISGEKGDIAVCRTDNEFKSTLKRYIEKGFYEVLFQKLIEGENPEEVAVTGVRTLSGIVETYGMIHKIRIRGNGSTVFARYTPEIDFELQSAVKRFVESTGYFGIFDMEFLHNDQGYHFIECNFRNGAYGYAVTSAGFNMPATFAANAPKKSLVRSVTFMEERSDILNVMDRTITLREWLVDLIKCNTLLWWNRKDPSPVLAHYWHKIMCVFHK